MARSVIEYRDFSGGEFGRLGAWRAPKNAWTGTNMLVYRTGELGVRPGVAEFSLTGKANGEVWALTTNRIDTGSTATRIWYGQGDKVHMFNQTSPGAVTDSAASLTTTPTTLQPTIVTGDAAYLAHADDGLFKISGTGATLALQNAFTAVTGCAHVALFGERLWARGDDSNPHRLYYSDPNAFGTWDFTNNFINIGSSDAITGLAAQRGHLVVCKTSGFYVVTGAPGINLGHRLVASISGPSSGTSYDISPVDDVLWYTHPLGYYPATFNGASGAELDHLKPGDLSSLVNKPRPLFLRARDRKAVLYLNDGASTALARINGAWSLHNFGVTVKSMGAPFSHTTGSGATLSTTGAVCLTDGGAAGANPKFYSWSPLLDRPGLESAQGGSANYERAGDASTSQVSGSVTFPEWHSEGAQEVVVRAVVVDFRSWNTGGSLTNHFDVKVDALRLFDASSPRSSSTQSFDQAGSDSSSSGTLQRRVFTFGSQGMGNGYQLVFENIRGIAIQRIQVVLDTQPARFL